MSLYLLIVGYHSKPKPKQINVALFAKSVVECAPH